jgi:hypothetical protein
MLRQVAFMLAAIHRLASIVARQYIAFYTSLPDFSLALFLCQNSSNIFNVVKICSNSSHLFQVFSRNP